jgi:hypothetical protein
MFLSECRCVFCAGPFSYYKGGWQICEDSQLFCVECKEGFAHDLNVGGFYGPGKI